MKSDTLKFTVFLAILLCLGNIGLVSAGNNVTEQQRKVTGRVMDARGELLIGVNVLEVGTTNGVITDMNGTYTITTTTADAQLKFTYIGFVDKIVTVKREGIMDVTLEEDVATLDEVVVVGFGTQKKASVVGSIANVEPAKLQMTPSRSLSNNLAGMVSGVIAVQRSGNPWFNNSDFWIRGISSYAGNTSPLVLVDGIERSLHDIDPEEIESFSVLKDAAASAVYGVRGANGVIMINTKRGKIGKPTVDIRFERSLTAPNQVPDYIGSVKYLELLNDMYAESGKAPRASAADLLNYKYQTDPELYPDIDWWDLVSKDFADNTKANLSVNGGSDILRYSMVLGYYSENGIIERDSKQAWDSSLKVDRYTVRTNVDANVTSTTLLRVNLGGMLQVGNSPPGQADTNVGIFYHAMRTPPFEHPAIYADGRIPHLFAKENPWSFATQRGYMKANSSKVDAMTSVEQDLKFITKGLSAKLIFAFDKYTTNSVTRSKNPDYYGTPTGRDDNGNIIAAKTDNGQQFLGYNKGAEWGDQSVYLEGNIAYNRVFARKHDVNAMLLYNQKNYDNGDKLPFRTQGFAGRLSYTFDTRYVAEFNFGYNGSENFAKGKRFGFFPAVAVGWIVSQEKFMKPVENIISTLKLRGSIGQVGNGNIDGRRFAYLTTIINTGEYTYGTDDDMLYIGKAEGEVGVPDLTWETVTKSNLGIDVGLFNNTINLVFDVFKESRKDIFIPRENVPGSAGFNRVVWANYGKVDNKGFDMSLNVNKQINKDWFISAMANYTFARNKIIEMDEKLGKVGTHRAETGHPVNQLFGYIAEGLFTEDDFDGNGKLKPEIPRHNFSAQDNLRPGDIKYRDLDGDGAITELDQTAIGGTVAPEIVYGFGANLKYKSVDFGFFFQGVGNTYQILGGENWLPGAVSGAGNIFSNIDDRWTVDNPNQNVFWPRMGELSVENNRQKSTWWLKDMSFVRLKNVEVGYTFPTLLTRKIGIRNCRLFLRGSNLLTFSGFKLWDPELETTDGLKYPHMKSISIGLSINFNN